MRQSIKYLDNWISLGNRLILFSKSVTGTQILVKNEFMLIDLYTTSVVRSAFTYDLSSTGV
jgi:hypothetical protein